MVPRLGRLRRDHLGAQGARRGLASIRVNVVAPGVVRSPLWSEFPEAEREAMYGSVGRGLPLGRIAEVEDIAKAYLQRMDQDYATGTVSVIDGGTVLACPALTAPPQPRTHTRPSTCSMGATRSHQR